jgi:hypothetical protein
MKLFKISAAAALLLLVVSCTKEKMSGSLSNPSASNQIDARSATTPAYYDSAIVQITLSEYPPDQSLDFIAHNKSINRIFATKDLQLPQDFIAVIDALQGEKGFNPLWQRYLITFNSGFTPHQFYSDDQIYAAVTRGEITLTATNEVYKCAVVGGH